MCDTVNVDSLVRWMREFTHAITDNKDVLRQCDTEIGDGDHGINMNRGLAVLVTAMDEQRPSNAAELLRDVVAKTIGSAAGGASGVLYFEFFRGMANVAAEAESLDALAFARALRAGLDRVVHRGSASVGDKSMVDTLVPAIDVLDAALVEGVGLGAGLRIATVAADAGRAATKGMLAKVGRAAFLGVRSVGVVDPGATSSALLIAAAATAFADVP